MRRPNKVATYLFLGLFSVATLQSCRFGEKQESIRSELRAKQNQLDPDILQTGDTVRLERPFPKNMYSIERGTVTEILTAPDGYYVKFTDGKTTETVNINLLEKIPFKKGDSVRVNSSYKGMFYDLEGGIVTDIILRLDLPGDIIEITSGGKSQTFNELWLEKVDNQKSIVEPFKK